MEGRAAERDHASRTFLAEETSFSSSSSSFSSSSSSSSSPFPSPHLGEMRSVTRPLSGFEESPPCPLEAPFLSRREKEGMASSSSSFFLLPWRHHLPSPLPGNLTCSLPPFPHLPHAGFQQWRENNNYQFSSSHIRKMREKMRQPSEEEKRTKGFLGLPNVLHTASLIRAARYSFACIFYTQ